MFIKLCIYLSKGDGMKKRRQYIKNRDVSKKTSLIRNQEKLYKQTLKNTQKVNERIKSLNRRYKKGTWSVKRLINRLDTNILSVWKNGRIQLNKNLTKTQLIAINKATNQFLESKTSTKSGIKEVSSNVKESLKETLSDDIREITNEEVDFMYDMLGDNDFSYFNKDREDTNFIGASELWIVIDEAINKGDDENTFLNRMNVFVNVNDENIRNKAINIYNKYVV